MTFVPVVVFQIKALSFISSVYDSKKQTIENFESRTHDRCVIRNRITKPLRHRATSAPYMHTKKNIYLLEHKYQSKLCQLIFLLEHSTSHTPHQEYSNFNLEIKIKKTLIKSCNTISVVISKIKINHS